MAQYEHLPIYKKAMDLTVYIENMVKGFSRYHKYTLGADLRNLSRKAVGLIIRANSETEKHETLCKLRDAAEEIKVVARICREVKAFRNFKSFEHIMGEAQGNRQIYGQNQGKSTYKEINAFKKKEVWKWLSTC